LLREKKDPVLMPLAGNVSIINDILTSFTGETGLEQHSNVGGKKSAHDFRR